MSISKKLSTSKQMNGAYINLYLDNEMTAHVNNELAVLKSDSTGLLHF